MAASASASASAAAALTLTRRRAAVPAGASDTLPPCAPQQVEAVVTREGDDGPDGVAAAVQAAVHRGGQHAAVLWKHAPPRTHYSRSSNSDVQLVVQLVHTQGW